MDVPPPIVAPSSAGEIRVGQYLLSIVVNPALVSWRLSTESGEEFESGFAESRGLAESDARKAAIARILPLEGRR